MKNLKTRSGFTLVELAIVLVIIGLLVGGILAGQDLIKASTIRATISDIEKTNTAATAFRTKYSGLPGDLLSNKATEYGLLTSASRDGSAGKGDGNGLIEGCSAAATPIGCETALFWVDLSTAALIPSRLATYDTTTILPPTISASSITGYLPKQRIRDTAFLYAYPSTGRNYFFLGSMTQASSAAVAGDAVTPGEGRSIDEKLDDSYPLTGVVRATSASLTTADSGAAAATGVCVNTGTTPSSYNVGDSYINEVNCSLQLRASF